MKKSHKSAPRNLTLGDLILAVSNESHNSREATAAIADLLDNGHIRLQVDGRKFRTRLV